MKKIILLLLVALTCFQCINAQLPAINSFSPASGAIGSTVTITGTGFNATTANNIVFFGAVKAIVTLASTTSLSVTVPVGATYQYLSVTNLATNLTGYSSKPFTTTFAGNIAFTSTLATTGSVPEYVSISDIDGDGKPDLLVNANGNFVSVFRNISTSGTISFAARQDFTTGSGPLNICIGDINGDGKPDMIVPNVNVNTFSVFRNTSTPGAISFAARVDFSTGAAPICVCVGDIDNDGKPDIATANFSDNTMSVLRNTSSVSTISFAAKVSFAAGTTPRSICINDIDGDGKVDLAVTNGGSNTISLFRNLSTSGSISMAAKVDIPSGALPYSISSGDIDGDGKSDLAVTNINDNSVSVFQNISTPGILNFAAKIDFAMTSPNFARIADVDGDGKPDITITCSGGTSKVTILRNISAAGIISFDNKIDFTGVAGPQEVSIGDIDGDGKSDIVAPNLSTNTLSIFRQTVPVPVIAGFSPASGPIGTSVTITGSGFNATASNNIVFFGASKATVTSATSTSLTVTVPAGATYENISVTNLGGNLTAFSTKPFDVTLSGNILFATKQDKITGTEPYAVNIKDFDGDGKPDIAAVNNSSNNVSVFLNTSLSGTVSLAGKVDFTTGINPQWVSSADIDGDGKPDLLVANNGSGTVSILRNTSTLASINFATKTDFSTGASSGPVSLSVADIDGDGKPDIAVANSNSNTLSILINTSVAGAISFAAKVDFATPAFPFSVSTGDIDGDGKPDIAIANFSGSNFSVFRNTSAPGIPSFATRIDVSTGAGTQPGFIGIADMDADGKPDISVTISSGSRISVFKNTTVSGTISFAPKVDFTTAASPYAAGIADIDGDGKPDIAVGISAAASKVSVLQNNSVATIGFAPKVDLTTGAYSSSVSIADIDGDGRPDLVANNSGSNTISILQQLQAPPVITSFSPANGYTGNSVAITGTHLTGVTAVSFGGVNAASFTIVDDSHITAIVGSGNTGVVSVTTATSIASSISNFIYNGYVSAAVGDWNAGSTWLGGNVPPVNANKTLNHQVQILSPVTNSGNIIANSYFDFFSAFTNSGTVTINYSLQMGNGGSFTNSGGTIIYSGGTNLGYYNTIARTTGDEFPALNGPFNLYISNSGGVTLNAPRTILGVLYLITGIFNTSTNNITIANNATLDRSGGSISTSPVFGASVNLTYGFTNHLIISGAEVPATPVVQDLTIQNTYGVSLTTNIVVNNSVSFYSGAGKINTGVNKLILAVNAFIYGNSSTQYINGNLQRSVQTGSSGIVFPVGDATDYRPVNINFTGVTTAGDLTVSVSATAGDHPNINTSNLLPSKSVNRYWTLSNNGIAGGTYDATFEFVSGDVDVAANTANFIIGKYNAGNWTYPAATAVDATHTKASAINGFGDFAIAESLPTITVNLKMYLQGYYLGGGLMDQVLINEAVAAQANETDTVIIELHDATTFALVDSKKAVLLTNGTVSATFGAHPFAPYYIAIKHRNTIQTWTANPVAVTGATPLYDFTTAANKAFGNNMILVGGVWTFFTGDINQDDFIDGNDFSDYDNDSFNSVAGEYKATDFNGDGFVDGNDFSIYDNNSFHSVTAIYPQ